MMSSISFGISGPNAPAISEKIAANTLNAVQQLLPQDKIRQVCQEVGHVYRERVLSPAATVLHMILAALWPEESFNAAWQVQWAGIASRYPELAGHSPSRGTVSNARNRLPLALWENLFQYVSHTAQGWAEAFASWRDHRVVLLDGTCVSMPDEPALFEAFGVQTGCHGPGRYPLARAVTLCLAGTMTVIDYALENTGDSHLFRPGWLRRFWAWAQSLEGYCAIGSLVSPPNGRVALRVLMRRISHHVATE